MTDSRSGRERDTRRGGGKEWTNEEFQKRKQFLIETFNELSPESQKSIVNESEKDRRLWARLIMSTMYEIQYEKKFDEFKYKWVEMKRMYLEMIELLLKSGDVTIDHEFEDAKYRIQQDCNAYKLGFTDHLSDNINRYFLTKRDREYLREFIDYPDRTHK